GSQTGPEKFDQRAVDQHAFGRHALAPALVLFGAFPDAADGCGVAIELLASGFGERVGAASFDDSGFYQLLVFELLKGRIDAAGARFVDAARAVAHLLHDLVAVLGTVLEEREDGEANLAGVEEAGVAAHRHGSEGEGATEVPDRAAHDISQDISIGV